MEAIDHVEVTTRNMKESVEFYEKLGFKLKSRYKMDGSRGITEIVNMNLGESWRGEPRTTTACP
ncbi:MAG: VOC family protein [Candidatus Bathyarchaeota archaeon]|nr:VOC family protein [Candidatus Bathyarchaeota archaeon]